MDTDFKPTPHEEAAALVKGKPIVTREVFDQMLPEIRGRVFTITGVEGANVMQSVRDAIASLPQGQTWDEAKSAIVDELSPYLGEGADRRAELLLRTHGFQAFQASNWRVAQEDEDTTHLQYLATEDDRVRDSHLALNGLILPKDDPFWQKHYPPWEWGCRCRVRPINPDLLEEARQEDQDRLPENRLVMEGPALAQLRNGTLIRDGRKYDVTPPSDSQPNGTPFQWHPDDLRLPLAELEKRYEPEVWKQFEKQAKATLIEGETSVWKWLEGQKLSPIEKKLSDAPINQAPLERQTTSVPESGLAYGKGIQKRSAEKQQQEREKASPNFKPTPLDEADIQRRIAINRKAIADNIGEDLGAPGSEAIPAPTVKINREPTRREKAQETFKAEYERLQAMSDLYYQQNPAALDAIRQWTATELAKLKQRLGLA